MLIADKNLVNVVWVSWASGYFVPEHLENVLNARGIIDVDVGHVITVVVCEECQLQISIKVRGLEAARSFETGGGIVQAGISWVE